MLDPSAADSPVFVAPDGLLYVDRDGVGETTHDRWRHAFDPRTVRRRQRRAEWLPLALASVAWVAGAALGAGAVAGAWAVSGRPHDAEEFVWAATSAVVLGGAAFITVVFTRGRPSREQPTTVPVPAEVAEAAPSDATAADVWRWSTVVRREQEQRWSIGFETYVERGLDHDRAVAAAARYTADYRAYRAVAEELGTEPRDPAIDLDDPIH